mgnify:CR=1 FL=1
MSDFAYPLHEECGVFGIYDRAGTEDVAAAAYSALYALQHRGQESCGIAVNDDGVINGHRDLGLVNEVFTPAVLGSLAKPTATWPPAMSATPPPAAASGPTPSP